MRMKTQMIGKLLFTVMVAFTVPQANASNEGRASNVSE